jgi:glycosyltransferase involved in cell wall biosynthesis
VKLSWFSPLPPARTGIADYTAQIVPALRERADLVLWTDQPDWDTSLEQFAEVRRYRPEKMPWAELNRSDVCVYNVGNNCLFHEGIWRVSQQHAGVVVLHDLRLHDFFFGMWHQCSDRSRGRAEYMRHMARHYGERGFRDALALWDGRLSPKHAFEAYPMVEVALGNALGVVLHTRQAYELLQSHARWPVAYAPLPYAAAPRRASPPSVARSDASGRPPYRLITFGYIGPNRRVDSLLRALADLPERNCFRLDILGKVWDPEHLRSQVRSLGLDGLVTLRDGFVPEAELDAALVAADVAVNLRFPTAGEASHCQLRIWEHALPSLVTCLDWYASLPEDAVAFVHPESEILDIQTHLRAFLADPARFALMGESGRRLLEERHSPRAYTESVTRLAEHARHHRSQAVTFALAERVGASMGAWLEPDLGSGLASRVARNIHALTS